jgi:DNA topoisomerase-1
MKYKFTANIEELLDQVADGKYQWTEVIKTYYQILKPMIDKLIIQKKTGVKAISNGSSEGSELEREIGTDPKTGAKIIEKMTRYGLRLILKLSEIDTSQKDKYVKINQEDVSDISLEKASELFKYPINFGKKNGKELILDNGDYGFYLKFDEKSYNLKNYMDKFGLKESDIIKWNLDQALKVKDAIETEKKSNVFKQLDNHISINKGKDNYYIMYKWGKSVCFASIPKGKTHMDITLEEAKEAIDKKRNAGKNTTSNKKDDNKKDDKKDEKKQDTINKKKRVKKTS